MKKVSIGLLRPNTISTSIYGGTQFDDFYSSLKRSIEKEGILEPLVITQDFLIISGVRRYTVALEIGLELVPVVFSPYSQDEVDEYLVVNHQEQRVKTPVQIFHEIEIINKKYRLVQGRKSSDPMVIKGTRERSELIKKTSVSTYNRLKESKKTLKNHLGSEEMAMEELYRLEMAGGNANSILKEVSKLTSTPSLSLDEPDNIKGAYEGLYKIYEANALKLSFLKDASVDLVFTSPPYYNLRDYMTGDQQLGNEETVELFIKNLVTVFMECARVMKPTASLFINIMDSHKDRVLLNVPGKLKQALMDKGLLLVSEIIWVKNNSLPISGKRPQPCYEVIYHFAKTLDYKYYRSWISDHEFEGMMTRGDLGKSARLKNFFDYRNQIVQTNSANNAKLKNFFKSLGYELNHSATMPFEVPNVGVLSTTEVGDVVLDPFNGLGTTGMAAISQGRYYIGVDNNIDYIQQAELRLKHFIEAFDQIPDQDSNYSQAA